MLLQAAIAAMVISTGLVVVELRRIDEIYAQNQEKMYRRLNATSDQLENMNQANQNMHAINKVLHNDVNNLSSTVESYGKELDLYKGKGKEEE